MASAVHLMTNVVHPSVAPDVRWWHMEYTWWQMQYTQVRLLMYMMASAVHLMANSVHSSEAPDIHDGLCSTYATSQLLMGKQGLGTLWYERVNTTGLLCSLSSHIHGYEHRSSRNYFAKPHHTLNTMNSRCDQDKNSHINSEIIMLCCYNLTQLREHSTLANYVCVGYYMQILSNPIQCS